MANQKTINDIVIYAMQDFLESVDTRISPYSIQPTHIFGLIKSMGNFAGFQLGDGDILKIFRSISHTILEHVNAYIEFAKQDLKHYETELLSSIAVGERKRDIDSIKKEVAEFTKELVDLKKAKVVLMELRNKNGKPKPRKKK